MKSEQSKEVPNVQIL